MSRRPTAKRPATDDAPLAAGAIAADASAWLRLILVAVLLAFVTTVVFSPVGDHGFVNWDDGAAVADNTDLVRPLPGLVSWAFTTTRLGHYQPLSWLAMAWAAGAPPDARGVHAVSIALHAVNAAGLFVLLVLLARGIDAAGQRRFTIPVAAAAAMVFAVHPLRVEPVAWASALPYLLSYAWLLAAAACGLVWIRHDRRPWLVASTALFALSQLSRPTAPLFPLVMAALAAADPLARPRSGRELARALVPMTVIAIALAAIEATARDVETLSGIGLGPRLAALIANPALYLWRTLWPVNLSPLDVWPRQPMANWGAAALGAAGLTAAIWATVQKAGRRVAVALWGTYLALLLPVLGLTPSGLQATADRYTYGPAMALSAALMAGLANARPVWRSVGLMACVAIALPLVFLTREQIGHWRDSVALWTRTAAIDPDNDVALYNLALALDAAGRPDEAVAVLKRLVAVVPEHDLGRKALATRLAARELAAGDAAADAGRLAEAVAAFDRALEHDPGLATARTHRGMAWMQRGNAVQAAADLEPAVRAGGADPLVVGALALAWSSTGRTADAIGVLSDAEARRPGDIALAGNLARLLVTAEPPALRDPTRALTLAARLNDATAGRDPRVLDTLALALVATGRRREAGRAWDVAIAVAAESGDLALAGELRARRAAVGR